MVAIQMRIAFQIVSESNPESIFDSVSEALFDQEAASQTLLDADVTASVSENRISLSIIGTGETIEAATENASSAIRAAIHRCGGATPGWDQSVAAEYNQAQFNFVEQTAVLA